MQPASGLPIIKGHLPLGRPQGMEQLLQRHGKLFKDLKGFVLQQSERIKEHARRLAEESGRPYEYQVGPIAKDKRAREIAERDGVREGLVCVIATVEPCRSFRLSYGEGRPRILPARRKCLFLYYYFIDPVLGFLHVRIQTWFPLTIQVYVNGHEWLASQLDARGIGYRRLESTFLSIDDPVAAQDIAERFVHLEWTQLLHELARRVNPLLEDLLAGYRYYWAVNQSEYATNLMFADRPALEELYPCLLRHATLHFSAEDVLTFLGRKLHHCFVGDVMNRCKKRWPGARVKHHMKQNWIKMYNKHGSVLRADTVINNPYEFKVRRTGTRRGREVVGWFPLPKGIAHFFRFAEVCLSANRRYLDALATVRDPTPAFRQLGPGGLTLDRAGFAPAGRRSGFPELIASFFPPWPAGPGRNWNAYPRAGCFGLPPLGSARDDRAGRAGPPPASRAGRDDPLTRLIRIADLAMFLSAIPGTPGLEVADDETLEKDLRRRLPPYLVLQLGELRELLGLVVEKAHASAAVMGVQIRDRNG